MKFSEVLKREREKRDISPESAAEGMGLSLDEYMEFENDNDQIAEEWANNLVDIAIELEVPTSRLLSKTGKSKDIEKDECGKQIVYQRENSHKKKTISDIIGRLEMTQAEYAEIENCNSPIEKYGPLYLAFAELMDIPVINILCPEAIPYKLKRKERKIA